MNFFVFLFSISIFTLSSHSQELTKKRGVIREITCNSPSGLGYIKLEYSDYPKKGQKKTLYVKEWLRVNSFDLCGSKNGRTMSRLASIGYDAIFGIQVNLYEVTIHDDFVTQIKEVETVDYYDYTKRAKQFKQLNNREVFNWWTQGPAFIMFERQENIDKKVKEYTDPKFYQNIKKEIGR